jgi:hypothetical protein
MKFPQTAHGNHVNVLGRKPPDQGHEEINDDKILLFYLDPQT